MKVERGIRDKSHLRAWLLESGWCRFARISAHLLNATKINSVITWQPGQPGKPRSRYRGARILVTGLRFFHVIAFARPAHLIEPIRVQNQPRSGFPRFIPSAIERSTGKQPHSFPVLSRFCNCLLPVNVKVYIGLFQKKSTHPLRLVDGILEIQAGGELS